MSEKPINRKELLKIVQIASAIGCKLDQKQTLIGLGLKKINKPIVLENTPSVRGMLRKVKHLVNFKII